MKRNCDVCNEEFNAAPRQKRHEQCASRRASKNRTRTLARDAHDLTFIGVDGEGVSYCTACVLPLEECPCGENQRAVHDYVLLSVGDQHLSRPDGARLSWREIFTFLYQQYEANPDAVYVGFFLGYDFAQWVRTMPESRGRMLYDKKEIAKRRRVRSGGNTVPFPVYIDEWECDVLPGRRFKIRPRHEHTGWMYICDVGPFFQTSFLAAIDPKEWPTPIVSDADYALITHGKERRAVAQLDEAMLMYNLAENRALAALMTVLNGGFVASGIRLNRDQWFGPGQAAQAWMGLVNCPTGQSVRDAVPQYALDAARASYYGGWFELFAHGHIAGVSYENDEISSYPYTISTLPCLLHGEWNQGNGPVPHHDTGNNSRRLAIVRAEVWGSDQHIGTMLHRTPRGTIHRPHHTRGWFWQHELTAAQNAGIIDRTEVYEHVTYDPCDCPPPLAAIADLFELRKYVGKNTPYGKALKLIYNSVYGKCAQSIGNPKYSNAVWASLITSWTRTRILNAIGTHPGGTAAVLMVATDGVYFNAPHPTLEFSHDQLGKWEQQEKHNLTLFMPGMYWDDKTRDRLKDGESPKLKSRGVSARALADRITQIDSQFSDIYSHNTWPITDLDINFVMISPAQAIQRGDWRLAGHVIQSSVRHSGECSPGHIHIRRTISADPVTKRAQHPYVDNGVIRTVPYLEPYYGPLDSTPYDGSFGEAMELLLTDEQDAISIIGEMLLS